MLKQSVVSCMPIEYSRRNNNNNNKDNNLATALDKTAQALSVAAIEVASDCAWARPVTRRSHLSSSWSVSGVSLFNSVVPPR